MTAILVAMAALLGLAVGSFLNVVIARVPAGESVAHPRSRCPGCTGQIGPRDNVPVVSWLLLRGRCRTCNMRISPRYPFVELLTALLFVVLALHFGVAAELPAFLYLAAVGLALAFIDIDTRRLPNALVLPSYLVGALLLAGAVGLGASPARLAGAGLGMVALYGIYFAIAFAYPAGMGFGDVKLAGVLGLYLGWIGWGAVAVGFMAGFLLGGVAGVALMALRRGTRKSALPFGPFMLLGTLVAILAGPAIATSWITAFSA